MRERRYAPLDALKRITVLEAAPGGAEVNNLGAAVTWANIPIANVPTGTSGTTVALGDHTHTGVYSDAAHVHEGTVIDATAVTDGWVLTADGAGNSAWEASASGGLANVVEDLTPQLGGNLDPNSKNLTGTIASTTWTLPTSGNFTFSSDGTGRVAFDLGTDGYWESNDGGTNVVQSCNNTDFRFSVTGTGFDTHPCYLTGFLDLKLDMPIKIKEQAAADADLAGYGQLWVNTATPNELWFTGDTGVDIQITDATGLAGGGGSPTSLSTGTVTATTYGITSDGSADDVVLVEATTSTAGLLGSAKWNEIVANTAKVTNATHTGDVTGSTALTIAAGAVDIAMLSASGTADATTFLRGDNTWATPAGGSAYLVHTYVSDETSLVDSNSPVARRFFRNTHRDITLLDLSNFTQCRLVVNKQGVAGAAAYQLSVEYRAAGFSTSVANYVDIGTSAVSCACNVTNTIVDSGWINLAAGAIADSVAVCVTSEGGDGVLDPQFGSVVIQFR